MSDRDEVVSDFEQVVNVKRHQARRSDGEVEDSTWRRSLMNSGHDPLK